MNGKTSPLYQIGDVTSSLYDEVLIRYIIDNKEYYTYLTTFYNIQRKAKYVYLQEFSKFLTDIFREF